MGSFLNAYEWRLSRSRSISTGSSSCDFCGKKLTPAHLLPIIGWFLLKGKSACCKNKLPIQYPIIEFCLGAFAVLSFNMATPLLSVYTFAFSWIMILVLVYDVKYMLVPVKLLVYASFFFLLGTYVLFGPQMFLMSVTGGIVGYAFYFIQYHISNGKWVGGGDMYIALYIGVALGVKALAHVLLLAYIIGALVGVFLIAIKKASRKTRLPMGVFLSIASLIILVFGFEIRAVLAILGYG